MMAPMRLLGGVPRVTSFIPRNTNHDSVSLSGSIIHLVELGWAHIGNGSCVTSLLEPKLGLCHSTVTLGEELL